MALTVIYQGRTEERDTAGITTSITYSGTLSECTQFIQSNYVGRTYSGLGRLDSMVLSQQGGSIYNVTARYQNANGASGGGSGGEDTVVPPDYSFGSYSATLDGSMLSTPLEQHPSYRKNWNYYLLGRCKKPPETTPPTPPSPPATPAWWSTATATTVMSDSDQMKYKWVEHESETPIEDDYVWVTLQNPQLAGFQSYDRALFTETESQRCQTYAEAVALVATRLNKIGTPTYTSGMSDFDDGKWKCDRATVQWTGDYWLATLTWTYSPDGWNQTLYQTLPT